jgi:predicted RNA-binding protein with PIN domain
MARMLWVIDGYNVIRRDPDLRSREAQSLEEGRRALMQLVRKLARTIPRDEFVVVFDGALVANSAPTQGQVRVMFSRSPESADDLVIQLAGQSRAGSVVVTSDRAVQQAANRARSAVVGAETFVARAARAAERRTEDDSVDIKPDDYADDRPDPKRGNPRRPSKKARATARALKRLR